MDTIKKINKYLLENHPTIWNTKIVWMLGISFSIHLLFYLLGFFSISDVEQLYNSDVRNNFFTNGLVFFNIIITLLLLVFWLIFLFKNNAFLNFYPHTSKQLFVQFVHFVVIVFSATTFYFSYQFGLKTYASINYPDEILYEEIKKTNEASIFFSHSLESYTIDQRNYPAPFNEIICETDPEYFKENHPKYEWLNLQYQFFIYEKGTYDSGAVFYKQKDEPTIGVIRNPFASGYTIFEQEEGNLGNYVYFQDKSRNVTNVSAHAIDLKPSYFNFSDGLYSTRKERLETNSIYESFERDNNAKNYEQRIRFNTFVYHLLKDPNSKEKIRKIINDFMPITAKYHIKTNLNSVIWLELIFAGEHPYEIAYFIKKEKPKLNERLISEDKLSTSELFVRKRTSPFYLESANMYSIFDNIEDIRLNNKFLWGLQVYMWFSIGLAVLVLIFKTNGLKKLLFSIISGGISAIIIGVLVVFLHYVMGVPRDGKITYFILVLIGLLVQIAPKILMKRNLKNAAGICINLSLLSFPFLVFFIYAYLTAFPKFYDYRYDYMGAGGITEINNILNPVFMVFTIIFVYFRCFTIQKWKGLPEG